MISQFFMLSMYCLPGTCERRHGQAVESPPIRSSLSASKSVKERVHLCARVRRTGRLIMQC